MSLGNLTVGSTTPFKQGRHCHWPSVKLGEVLSAQAAMTAEVLESEEVAMPGRVQMQGFGHPSPKIRRVNMGKSGG